MGYGYLVAALVFMVAVAGAGIKGYSLGGDSVRSAYAERDLKAAAENAAKFQAISGEYRAKEQAAATASAAVSKAYQKRISAYETRRLADLAAVDARTIVLRDTNSAGCAPGRDTAPPLGADTAGHSSPQGSDLSRQAATFLLGLAAEADRNTAQLGACQDLLESERK